MADFGIRAMPRRWARRDAIGRSRATTSPGTGGNFWASMTHANDSGREKTR